jgi:DNA invertase Pin-like site-specific DNA recombinase
MRIALYARCSTKHQDCDAQLAELRRYAVSRDAIALEYVDSGISGAKTSRPELDRLLNDAKTAAFDVIAVVKLDRLGRSLSHLVGLLEQFRKLKIGFISLRDSIDMTTPAGEFMMHMLAAMAQFERSLIAERVKAGMRHAKENGAKFGAKPRFDRQEFARLAPKMGTTQLAKHFGVSRQAILMARNKMVQSPAL